MFSDRGWGPTRQVAEASKIMTGNPCRIDRLCGNHFSRVFRGLISPWIQSSSKSLCRWIDCLSEDFGTTIPQYKDGKMKKTHYLMMAISCYPFSAMSSPFEEMGITLGQSIPMVGGKPSDFELLDSTKSSKCSCNTFKYCRYIQKTPSPVVAGKTNTYKIYTLDGKLIYYSVFAYAKTIPQEMSYIESEYKDRANVTLCTSRTGILSYASGPCNLFKKNDVGSAQYGWINQKYDYGLAISPYAVIKIDAIRSPFSADEPYVDFQLKDYPTVTAIEDKIRSSNACQ